MNEKKVVLVVDDEELLRNLFIDQFKHEYEILVAPGVDEAIKIIQDKRPDVIVTDLIMPDKLGTDLRDWVLSNCPEIPIMLITATPYLIPEGERKGFVDCIIKPFRKERLLRAIDLALVLSQGARR